METITIEEVYEQCLANGWLGNRSKAKVKLMYSGNEEILMGALEDCMVTINSNGTTKFHKHHNEVQWTGNPPKKKMLYACLALSDHDSGTLQVLYAPKEVVNGITMMRVYNNKVCKWLPEDQYPPIEIEDN